MTKRSETSEKAIEKYLRERVKALGGVALKFSSAISTGYPDRLLHLPQGVTAWVELKSYGKTPTRLQLTRIKALRDLGLKVGICDSRESVDAFLKSIEP